ncbi:MAG: non-canonical purine NTP pyrophosphatase [Oscillospiraceae bacterium]|nr:non-canonical purine NTP pyrophosphatase [Oscillospiraceae bacterium]
MKILIGTTNPAKVARFREFLPEDGIEFLTLKDLGITDEPEESGATPEENARIKAAFYGRFCDRVICNDSGLYFDCIPMDDPRQPGLQIRTPEGRRLDDEEMIAYYSSLIAELGGKTLAYYLDGIAVYRQGQIFSYLDEQGKAAAFYMVDEPSPERHPGWPLDSLSLNKNTMTYFVDHGNNIYDQVEEQIMVGQYRQRVVAFLKQALGVEM